MFAILETGSKQYKVEEGDVLEIELLKKDSISEEKTVNFDRVLLIKNKELYIGEPFVENASVQAKVLEEFKAPKVIVFKKKSKKGYKKTRGHRQQLHRVQIEKILFSENEKGEKVKEESKTDSPPKKAKTKESPSVKAEKKPTENKQAAEKKEKE